MIQKLILALVILAVVVASRAYVQALQGDRDVERRDEARRLGCRDFRAPIACARRAGRALAA